MTEDDESWRAVALDNLNDVFRLIAQADEWRNSDDWQAITNAVAQLEHQNGTDHVVFAAWAAIERLRKPAATGTVTLTARQASKVAAALIAAILDGGRGAPTWEDVPRLDEQSWRLVQAAITARIDALRRSAGTIGRDLCEAAR